MGFTFMHIKYQVPVIYTLLLYYIFIRIFNRYFFIAVFDTDLVNIFHNIPNQEIYVNMKKWLSSYGIYSCETNLKWALKKETFTVGVVMVIEIHN